MDLKEKALIRAGSEVLAELLIDVVGQFVTPVEDPIYDWRIIPLTKLAATRKNGDLTWRVGIPETVTTGVWKAHARQCALAWGTRLPLSRAYEEGAEPSPVAVLVRAVQDPQGKIHAEIGAQFLYRRPGDQPGTWFRARGSSVDPDVSTLIIGFLNGQSEQKAEINGVDLDS